MVDDNFKIDLYFHRVHHIISFNYFFGLKKSSSPEFPGTLLYRRAYVKNTNTDRATPRETRLLFGVEDTLPMKRCEKLMF